MLVTAKDFHVRRVLVLNFFHWNQFINFFEREFTAAVLYLMIRSNPSQEYLPNTCS